MSVLRSYVRGGWHTPAPDEGRPLHDAVTGEEIARLSTDGVDMAAVARRTAGTSAAPRCGS